MRTMTDEIKLLSEQHEKDNRPLTAEDVVNYAKDAKTYPALHDHLWKVSESFLAQEARISRAHRLLISIHVVTIEGDRTRMLIHTPGSPGYRDAAYVARSPDLATIKLRQLRDDIARSRARLAEFRAILPPDVADEIAASLSRASDAADRGMNAAASTAAA